MVVKFDKINIFADIGKCEKYNLCLMDCLNLTIKIKEAELSKQHSRARDSELTPLEIGAEWVENFVNDLGGDFSAVKNDGVSITLQNKSSCPGLCLGKCDYTTCNEIEKTINDAVKYFDCHFTAGFIECAHEAGNGCVLTVSFNL